jgi:Ca-activated chloride channel family protein
MKRLLGLWLLLLCSSQLFGAGLIIVGDEEFWRGGPPVIVPPQPAPWPEPRPQPPPPIHERRIIIPPRPVPNYSPLEVSFTKADIKIRDQFATTKVEQEFYNPNPRVLEGTFLFPVPKGAHIDKFTMNIDGKPVEAELLAADKARGIYEDIVRRQRDPALLEYAGRDLFKVRIFPIEPNARKKITLSYSQLLKSDAGLLSYVLPLNTEKFSAKPLRSVSVKLELESKRELKSIYSPTHKVEVKRDGSHKATVGFEANDVKPDGDFQVFFTQDDADLGLSLLTYKPAGEDGYFLLLASPGIETKNVKVIPKDLVFVLDTSGSMAGAKLEQAKKALSFCIENLNDGDRFEVMRFSTEVEPLFDKLTDATKENRAHAQKFVSELKPIGGTAIDDALKKAVALRPENGSRPYVIVFLTDGRPTVGNVDENQILENATKSKTGLTRIFCFGIGTDVNTHLLDHIAEETKAFSQYVLPEEDIEVKVSSFFTKIKEPVLASPSIKFPDSVRVTKIYPSPVPDIFKGEQLLVAGRYSGSGDGAIQIEGNVNGDTKKFAYDVKFPGESSDNDFIPRLWATRRVGYLLDEIRLHGESKELKDEVTELARKYGVVTPYTAYLIQEDETRRNVPLSLRTLRESERSDQLGLARKESGVRFKNLATDKSGDGAVANARSFYALKSAETPAQAIVSGNVEALRESKVSSGPAPVNTSAGFSFSASTPTVTRARIIEQQSRFAGGKTFFQNGDKWIDSDVQKQQNAKRVRVQFGSEDYFALLRKRAEVKSWLAQSRNVEFVLDGTIYEVAE